MFYVKKHEMLENDEKKVKEENKNDELSIQNIGLSKRAVNSLDRGGIKLLNDLSNITEKDFHRIRGLGEKATNEIIDKMNEYNISFKGNPSYLEKIGLSARAVNSLDRYGIKSIYELSNITKVDLLEISDLGDKTVNEIIEMMKKYGVSFKYENDMLYIGNIGLSATAFNILNRQRIGLLSELSNITEEDLYAIKGIGEKTANEIIDKMKEHGISFKGESKDDKKLASTMFDVDGKFNSAYDNLIEEIYGVTGNIQLYSSEKLQEEIDKLGGNMKQVLEMRYGLLEGTLPKTYEEIGNELGVSRSRVEQILKRELRSMREPTRTRKIWFIRDFNEIKSNEFVTDEEKAKIDKIEATLDKVCMGEKNIDDIDAKECLDYLKEIKDRIEREKEERKKEMGGICIEEIGFSEQPYRRLKRYGINNLKDLFNITEADIKGLGKKTVDEIKATMGEHGISFSFKGESKIDKGNVSKNEDESASIEDETESVDNNIEQQQEVQEGQQPKQEETSTNNKEELESMSAEELQRTIAENDKTIYENDQALKRKLVERILEQQRIIAEQQNQISKLKSENKEL